MKNKDGKPTLKKRHIYYDQVQGQMVLTGAQWCDFIVYTNKGLSVERIKFIQHTGKDSEKLCDYYTLSTFFLWLLFKNTRIIHELLNTTCIITLYTIQYTILY